MSEVINVNGAYLAEALRRGTPEIKISANRMNFGGVYVLRGYELGRDGRRQEFCARLSEVEHDRVMISCEYRLPIDITTKEGS